MRKWVVKFSRVVICSTRCVFFFCMLGVWLKLNFDALFCCLCCPLGPCRSLMSTLIGRVLEDDILFLVFWLVSFLIRWISLYMDHQSFSFPNHSFYLDKLLFTFVIYFHYFLWKSLIAWTYSRDFVESESFDWLWRINSGVISMVFSYRVDIYLDTFLSTCSSSNLENTKYC